MPRNQQIEAKPAVSRQTKNSPSEPIIITQRQSRLETVPIGLALGGGAARGFAHILMAEAFDELGIRPHNTPQ